ncbi:hypothetical protein C8Q69DRAFT_274509 [Paecilomyces variotii]|uniref:Uncharacterized protein n=1 Tax=Byssochlamys spectabilis TaxID=264951 RepID=A0A443HSX7_BYSSP|nr:hypothetical protein C8Q69DRAFT_274509 [Paecilomyces variotii]RWQ94904.1 hypothetical protein C8Q69DRAFT_274509 [Paecilomyces variotii]
MSSPSIQIQPQATNGAESLTPRSSSEASAAIASFDIVRCSRCQRSLSLENASSPGVVRFGMNSYYCSRCASMWHCLRTICESRDDTTLKREKENTLETK